MLTELIEAAKQDKNILANVALPQKRLKTSDDTPQNADGTVVIVANTSEDL